MNRAWTDYVATFAEVVTGTAYADTEADYNEAAETIPVPVPKLGRCDPAVTGGGRHGGLWTAGKVK